MITMQIPLKNRNVIPNYCPKCDSKLYHINALKTKARSYMVYCSVNGCNWLREFKKCSHCGEFVCL